MSAVNMSDVAFKDFKQLLEDNKVDNNTVRINLAGMGWSGPMFNLVLDEQKENDDVTKIEDVTILVDKSLVEDFGGFNITCEVENGRGLSLEPVVKSEGGCSSCGGGCH